jgi:hypothetical protein
MPICGCIAAAETRVRSFHSSVLASIACHGSRAQIGLNVDQPLAQRQGLGALSLHVDPEQHDSEHEEQTLENDWSSG